MIHVSPWAVVLICVSLVVAALVAGVAITRARRLDRLHQRILASRDALSRLLLRRASEAELLAHAAGLESAGGPSLVDAARAYIQDGGDQLTTDGLDRRTSAQRQADRVEVSARLERASALTRAIRKRSHPTCVRVLKRIRRRKRDSRRSTRRVTVSNSHETSTTSMSRESVPCVPHEW